MSQVHSQSGESLVSVLVAATVGSLVMLAMTGFTSNAFKAVKHTELSGDFALLRTTLKEQVDCAATFASAGIDPNNPKLCNSNSSAKGQDAAGVLLRLRRKTTNGSVQFVTDALTGGHGKLGTFAVRATCSASEQSLIIRAARPQGSGFAVDPLTKRPDSWDNPKALLFGAASGALPLCYGSGSSIRRQANVVLGFHVYNTGTEFVELDLTGPVPRVVSGTDGISSWEWSEAFDKTGRILTAANVRSSYMNTKYIDVSATPPIYVTYPAPGRVRVSLGDTEGLGPPDGKRKGSMQIQLAASQY